MKTAAEMQRILFDDGTKAARRIDLFDFEAPPKPSTAAAAADPLALAPAKLRARLKSKETVSPADLLTIVPPEPIPDHPDLFGRHKWRDQKPMINIKIEEAKPGEIVIYEGAPHTVTDRKYKTDNISIRNRFGRVRKLPFGTIVQADDPTPANAPEKKKPGNPAILVRLPQDILDRLDRLIGRRKVKTTRQALIVEILADALNQNIPAPTRGRPQKEV